MRHKQKIVKKLLLKINMNFHLVFLLKLNLENKWKYKKNISNKGAITKNKLFKREELINLIVDLKNNYCKTSKKNYNSKV